MDVEAILTVAREEVRIAGRSRWTVLFAAVFAALALAIAYFGMATAGIAGFQGFERTTASLLNLVLYVVPLLALSMASVSVAREDGAGEMLYAQPVSRASILLGKVAGLFVSIATATLFGFGVAGVVIVGQAGADGLGSYTAFVGYALLLALVFLSIGSMIAVLARGRARAFGVSLLVWFVFVILYDLLVIGLTLVVRERTANTLLFLSLFGNPVDLVRVSGLMSVADSTIFGAAGAALVKYLGGRAAGMALMAGALALWTVCPLAIAARVLKNQDL